MRYFTISHDIYYSFYLINNSCQLHREKILDSTKLEICTMSTHHSMFEGWKMESMTEKYIRDHRICMCEPHEWRIDTKHFGIERAHQLDTAENWCTSCDVGDYPWERSPQPTTVVSSSLSGVRVTLHCNAASNSLASEQHANSDFPFDKCSIDNPAGRGKISAAFK